MVESPLGLWYHPAWIVTDFTNYLIAEIPSSNPFQSSISQEPSS